MRFVSRNCWALAIAGGVWGHSLSTLAGELPAPTTTTTPAAAAQPSLPPGTLTFNGQPTGAASDQPPLPPQPIPRLRQAALAVAHGGVRPATAVRPAVTPGFPANPQRLPAPPALVAPTGLGFDALIKTVEVKDGAPEAVFTFGVTNISKDDITITSVTTSCGCTAAKLPQQPWLLKPGDHGNVGATMHVTGKYGTVTKTLTIVSSQGSHMLTVRSILPELSSNPVAMRGNDRTKNLQIAAADRQAVFRGECAKCHVEPTVAKTGKDLYGAACGICHDAEHKASMVPTLAGRAGTFDEAYWNQWVRSGKVGSLMPAFEQKQGGPLSDEQIKSLTDYLANEFVLSPTITPVNLDLTPPAPAK